MESINRAPYIVMLSVIIAAAIIYADANSEMGVAIGIPYIALVLLSIFTNWKHHSTIAALIATFLILVGHFISPNTGQVFLDITNRLFAVFAIWVTTVLTWERRLSQAALTESESRYALAFRGAKDGFWIWNLISDKIYFSPRWKAILGWSADEIGDLPDEWFSRVHKEDSDRLNRDIEAHLNRQTDHFEMEHRLLHKDGNYRWVLSRGLAVWDRKKRATQLAGSMTDITKRKTEEEKFRVRMVHDALTGVFNRRHFVERLEIEIKSSKRYGYPLALCICDIDRFKGINDSYGHRMGDRVLARFGRLLKNRLRNETIAGRYGGDEFCIIFPHTKADKAAYSMERIRRHFEKLRFEVENGTVFTATATFGIADLADEDMEEKDLLELADKALYHAKEMGRNRIVLNSGERQLELFEEDRA